MAGKLRLGCITLCTLAAGACGAAARSRVGYPARLRRAYAPGSYKCGLCGSREHSGPALDPLTRPAVRETLLRKRLGRQPRRAQPLPHRFGCAPRPPRLEIQVAANSRRARASGAALSR